MVRIVSEYFFPNLKVARFRLPAPRAAEAAKAVSMIFVSFREGGCCGSGWCDPEQISIARALQDQRKTLPDGEEIVQFGPAGFHGSAPIDLPVRELEAALGVQRLPEDQRARVELEGIGRGLNQIQTLAVLFAGMARVYRLVSFQAVNRTILEASKEIFVMVPFGWIFHGDRADMAVIFEGKFWLDPGSSQWTLYSALDLGSFSLSLALTRQEDRDNLAGWRTWGDAISDFMRPLVQAPFNLRGGSLLSLALSLPQTAPDSSFHEKIGINEKGLVLAG